MNFDILALLDENIKDCVDHILDTYSLPTRQVCYYFWLLVFTLIALLHAKDTGVYSINHRVSDNIPGLLNIYLLRNEIAHADSYTRLISDIRIYIGMRGFAIEQFLLNHGYDFSLLRFIEESLEVL